MTKCFHLLLNKLYFFSLKYALEHAIFIHFYNFDSSFSMDHITNLVTFSCFRNLVYAYMGDRNAGTESILDIYGGSKLHQHILGYYRTINDELHEMCYAFKENQ